MKERRIVSTASTTHTCQSVKSVGWDISDLVTCLQPNLVLSKLAILSFFMQHLM